MYTTVIVSLILMSVLYGWQQYKNKDFKVLWEVLPLVVLVILTDNLLYISIAAIIISAGYFTRKLSIGRGGYPIIPYIVFVIALVGMLTYCGVKFPS